MTETFWPPMPEDKPSERCPRCGHKKSKLIPARFRTNGPFCNHEWHDNAKI